MNKYSVILGNLGNTCDRFLSSGYKEIPPKETLIRQASEIEGVKGIELVGTWDVDPSNVDQIGETLDKYNLKCVSIIPDHFGQRKWARVPSRPKTLIPAKRPLSTPTSVLRWHAN